MPRFTAKTVKSSEQWTSDDGKITRYDVTMSYKGKPLNIQTYSKQIAAVGWEGEVESYEKNGYTLVKQPQKETWSSSDGNKPAWTSRSAPRDDAAIKAQFAIKAAVALAAQGVIKPDDIEPQALDFFDMVERIKNSTEVTKEVTPKEEDKWDETLPLDL